MTKGDRYTTPLYCYRGCRRASGTFPGPLRVHFDRGGWLPPRELTDTFFLQAAERVNPLRAYSLTPLTDRSVAAGG